MQFYACFSKVEGAFAEGHPQMSGGHLLSIIDYNRKLQTNFSFSFVSVCGGKVHFFYNPPISFSAYGPAIVST